jgi:GntR family transcriptional regulator, galactonate operon transcriptional repressor
MTARRGMHGVVVDAIGRSIVSGSRPPGEVIDLVALETELGASRSVVREALRVLADKGLVDARPKRGTVVRKREAWSLLDPDLLRWQYDSQGDTSFLANLAEVRSIIEPAAAALAAARRTDDDLAAMREPLELMEDPQCDPEVIVQADLAFHRGLLLATHNDLLQRMELVIHTALRTRDELVHHSEGVENSAPAHRAVLDAIEVRDAATAQQAMEQLLDLAVQDEALVGAPPTAKAAGA